MSINIIWVLAISAIVAFISMLFVAAFEEIDNLAKIFGVIFGVSLLILILSIGGWVFLEKNGEKIEEVSVASIKNVNSIERHSYMYRGEEIEFDLTVDDGNKEGRCFACYDVSYEHHESLEEHVHINNDEHNNEVIKTETFYKFGPFIVQDFEEVFWTKMKIKSVCYELYISEDVAKTIPEYEILNLN